jgi:hypothetical protein
VWALLVVAAAFCLLGVVVWYETVAFQPTFSLTGFSLSELTPIFSHTHPHSHRMRLTAW